jgi:Xaa-Pro dipeptidase
VLLNRERANRIMDEYGLDALIATSKENITYLSDYSSLEFILEPRGQRYAVLPRDEAVAPTLVVAVSELEPLAQGLTWFPDIRAHGVYHIEVREGAELSGVEERLRQLRSSYTSPRQPLEALLAVLKEKRLQGARMGLDDGNITFPLVDGLREGLPRAEFVPASQVFHEIRMVKTPEEIGRLKTSSAINEEVLGELIDMVREGVSFRSLFEHYRQGTNARGATLRLWASGHGTASAASFEPSDTIIQKGDVVFLDTGCEYASYLSDMCRMGHVGEPSQRVLECYQAIMEGYRVALSLIKPGVMASTIFRAALEAVRERGLRNFRRHHLGHGTGLENHEPPIIGSPESLLSFKDYPLEEGMVICIEIPYYELGTGGISVEDMLLVTEDGWEYITTMSRELFVV